MHAALARLDHLLTRFSDCDHPLLHGMLHETRAFICWEAKRVSEYERSLHEVERHFRATGTPALIGKYEWLAAMSHTVRTHIKPTEQKSDALNEDITHSARPEPRTG